MKSKTDAYLSALRAIYNGTHTSTGGSFSMSKLLNHYKVPTTLSTVLQEEKLIRKTGTTRDVRYFWSAPVQPNIKMAEIALARVEAKMGNNPVKKEEVVPAPVVENKEKTQVVDRPVAIKSTQVTEKVQHKNTECKPLEYRVSFLFGLFKYEKIVN